MDDPAGKTQLAEPLAVIVVDLLEVVYVNQDDEEVSALRLLDCFLRKVHEGRPEHHPAQAVKISLDPELALVLLVLVKKQERGDPLSLHDMKKLGSRERHKLVGQHGQSGKDQVQD